MAKKNIGATISLKDNGFKSGIKDAVGNLSSFKKGSEKATSAVKTFGKQSDTTGQKLGSLAKKAIGVVAAYASFTKIVDFSKACIDAADKQAAAETRLESIMSNVKGTTAENISALKEYAAERQKVTTIGDEATIRGMSQLGTFQLQADTIKTLTPALQNLAVAQYGTAVSGDQMQQMANLMGKVMTGNVGALSRYGIVMDETQQKILKSGTESERAAMLVEVLGQNFGDLAAQMANTPEGRVQQLKNAWGDVKEQIGEKLYPIVTEFLTFVTAHIPEFQAALEGVASKAVPVVTGAFNKLKSAAKTILPILKSVVKNWKLVAAAVAPVVAAILTYKAAVKATDVMQKICNITLGLSASEMGAMSFGELAAASAKGVHTAATGALTAAQNLLNAAFLASPIGWIVLGIAAVVAAVIVLWNKSETFRNFVKDAFDKIKTWAAAAWEHIKATLAPVIESVKNAFKQAWELIKTIWNLVKPYFEGIWNGIKAVFAFVQPYLSGLFSAAWTAIKAVWDTVCGFFKAIWDTIAGIFSVVKDVLTGNWQGAWEGIKGIVSSWGEFFSGVWESIKSVFSAVGEWFSGIFSGAAEGIKNAFEGVKTFFTNLGDAIKEVWTGIVDSIKGAINKVIGGINTMIKGAVEKINSLIDTINNVTSVVGVSAIPHLSAPQIPLLAKGGTIVSSGNVIVGERGPEMLSLPKGATVTPLQKQPVENKTIQNDINITIHAENKSVDQIVDELVPKLKLAISNI